MYSLVSLRVPTEQIRYYRSSQLRDHSRRAIDQWTGKKVGVSSDAHADCPAQKSHENGGEMALLDSISGRSINAGTDSGTGSHPYDGAQKDGCIPSRKPDGTNLNSSEML